ncbi:hypothetical protein J2Y69_003079 [Microbacterium resistens]|uniref:Uncharacterized protein n=1 Tax=Microbacterium resistens TaxID=156977 RepID=A0ABU1SHJ9_9MICO|nr:hypothetical protein [Microbacterium resistens]MDR6868463.1 hypothetical protein [Microbacterium resistens]
MTVPVERTPAAQLTTARLLLAQFDEQIREFERMGAKRRVRTVRGRDLSARIGGLRRGRATWAQRVERLAEQIASESE